MPRSNRILESAAVWLGRSYGIGLFAGGAVFLYLSFRGFVAFRNGIRATWADPIWCGIALVITGLCFLAGFHLLKNRELARDATMRRWGNEQLRNAFEELKPLDQAAAHLSVRSIDNVTAADVLRRKLLKEMELNTLLRKDVEKSRGSEELPALLAELDRNERRIQSDLQELDRTVARLRPS